VPKSLCPPCKTPQPWTYYEGEAWPRFNRHVSVFNPLDFCPMSGKPVPVGDN